MTICTSGGSIQSLNLMVAFAPPAVAIAFDAWSTVSRRLKLTATAMFAAFSMSKGVTWYPAW